MEGRPRQGRALKHAGRGVEGRLQVPRDEVDVYKRQVRTVPASRTGAFLNLVPVLTLLMGMVFLDERLTPGQWAASALVLGGVVLSQWKTARAAEAVDCGMERESA